MGLEVIERMSEDNGAGVVAVVSVLPDTVTRFRSDSVAFFPQAELDSYTVLDMVSFVCDSPTHYLVEERNAGAVPTGMPVGFYETEWLLAFGADTDKLLPLSKAILLYHDDEAVELALSVIDKIGVLVPMSRGGYAVAKGGVSESHVISEVERYYQWESHERFAVTSQKVCNCCGNSTPFKTVFNILGMDAVHEIAEQLRKEILNDAMFDN